MQMVVPGDLTARAADLIGVPWVAKGTTPKGWDCLGLGQWCLAQWCGVAVASYAERYEAAVLLSPHRREERARLLAEGMAQWREVKPQAGVIARLRWMGRIGHVGFMLSPTLVLHADVTCGTALLDLTVPSAPYRLAGAFVPAFVSEIVTA